ncbi:OmpA family protein [Nitrogeniibacter mangrovi]|uniref:OmpA family protein n=1 Tax=Nitrogeniibacter mangrovi TaxID=2016596 RepID=A0A6C1B9R1_9RHOO|nr:OmpA family protein [Nitrogeniibacter mangrovi]QID19595.1 OmpA family protein [Nitrogeniibacter mangrovi]
MDEQDELGIPLAVVFFIVALVIALVIGVVTWRVHHRVGAPVVEAVPTPVAAVVTHEAAIAVAPEVHYTDIAPVGDPQLKVYFDVGQTDLSKEARANLAALSKLITRLDAHEAVVLISGFHDETGTAHVNAEVAKRRAFAVRDALIAEGVTPDMIQLRRPEVTLGGADAAEARRVEVRVQ